ncbi:MAG: cation:proton antiporter [Candidatus Berkiella sp.]
MLSDYHKLFLHASPLLLCGSVLILGLIGGEINRFIKIVPKISGYMLIGILVGPLVFNVINYSLINDLRIFVDVSLGLILFNLGRQLDFTWIKHDRSILYMSLAESGLTFILIYVAFICLGFSSIIASLAGTIAITTSPAILMMIVKDLSSEGPVTRRALILTSLNNLWGLLLFNLLLAIVNNKIHGLVDVSGDFLLKMLLVTSLALSIFILTEVIAKIIGKSKESQLILYISAILLIIGFADHFQLSIKMTLFLFGLLIRNLDRKNYLIEVDFTWGVRLAFIILFVITGTQLQLQGFATSIVGVLLFLFLRSIAKIGGIMLLTKKSRLTLQQSLAISLSLTPMAGIAIGMLSILSDSNLVLGRQVAMILGSAVTILHIIGPLMTQFVLIRSGEAYSNKN